MINSATTLITFDKKRLKTLLFLSIFLVSIGLQALTLKNPFFDNLFIRYIVYGSALISIFTSLFLFFYYIRKIKSDQAAIIIDEKGITDNSSATPAGLIPWKDLAGIKTENVFMKKRQQFILLILNNPQDYIKKQKGLIKRILLKLNFKKYGSPFLIYTNGLSMGSDELVTVMEESLIASKKSS